MLLQWQWHLMAAGSHGSEPQLSVLDFCLSISELACQFLNCSLKELRLALTCQNWADTPDQTPADSEQTQAQPESFLTSGLAGSPESLALPPQ